MKISEAKSVYYKQYQKFSFAASDLEKQKEEAEKSARLYPNEADKYNEKAATLQISHDALNRQKEEYMKYNEKLAEAECAEPDRRARLLRIMKGDIVPPQDEERLMKYNFKLYMAAKNMAVMAKEHEKDDSLWDEEKETDTERTDPMEFAGEQEAPEGGPSPDLEISDVVS